MTAWTDERKKPAKNRREIPKMPEGYYSGDKPNPNLRAFVEAHLLERPYDRISMMFRPSITQSRPPRLLPSTTCTPTGPRNLMMPSASTFVTTRGPATLCSIPSAARVARLWLLSWKAGRPLPSTAHLLPPSSPRTTVRPLTSLNCRRPSRS